MNKMRLTTVAIIAVLAISITQVKAQEKPVTFGVKAGVNLSNFGGDIKDTKSVFKYQVGFTTDIALLKNLYILTGLDFQVKGSKNKLKSAGDIKYNPMYLSIPAHLGYKFELSSGSKLVIDAGPYIAYGIGGKVKGDGSSEKIFGDNRLKRLDYGIGGGIGFEFNKFCVNAGYDLGLANISDMKGTKVKNRNAYLTFGYKF